MTENKIYYWLIGKNNHNWKGGKIIKKCIGCGKYFNIYQSQIKRNAGKYCSKQCFLTIKKENSIVRKCPSCGKNFRVWISISNKGKGIYCSKKCYTKRLFGERLSPKTEFKRGHIPWMKGRKNPQFSGINNPRWNGGKYINLGYVFIRKPDHPLVGRRGYVREHRLIAEKYLGRYLTSKEVIHHINEIKDDNRPENLYLFPNNYLHRKYHLKFYQLTSNII